MWFINAAKNNINLIEGVIVSSYKYVLSLSKNSSNKVYWSFSSQLSFKRRVAIGCDKFICRAYQLCKGKIINKIKYMVKMVKSKRMAPRNISYIVSKWPIIKSKLKYLIKYKIHPQHCSPFRKKFIQNGFCPLVGRLGRSE